MVRLRQPTTRSLVARGPNTAGLAAVVFGMGAFLPPSPDPFTRLRSGIDGWWHLSPRTEISRILCEHASAMSAPLLLT